MELLVIRHAKAEDHGHPGGDGERALVAKGFDQSARLGRACTNQHDWTRNVWIRAGTSGEERALAQRRMTAS